MKKTEFNILEGPFEGLPRNHFGLIYIDPPWNFETWSEKGQGKSPSQHYDVMDIEAIKSLPVAELAAENSYCAIWGVDPRLDEAFDVLKAYGFEYKTVLWYWIKLNRKAKWKLDIVNNWEWIKRTDIFKGMGRYTRCNPEVCIIGRKGTPPIKDHSIDKTIIEPVREHSRKPELHDKIERLFDGPYIELFSRSRRPGWTVWGNEVGKFDNE